MGPKISMLALAAILAASCATVPRARCPAAAEPRSVALDLDAEAATVVASPREGELVAALPPSAVGGEEGAAPDTVVSAVVGDRHVLVWARFGEQGCEAGVVVGVARDGELEIAARRELDHAWEAHVAAPFDVTLGVRDHDGDGRVDLLVHYELGTEPQPAVGGDEHEYVALFELPDLAVKWVGRVSELPGGSYFERCEGELAFADVDCDGHPDLVLTRTCGQGVCFEEPESWLEEDRETCDQPESRPTASVERYRWRAGRWE